MRNTKAEDNSGLLFLFLYIDRVSINANKYNIHIHDKRNDGLYNTNNDGIKTGSRENIIFRIYG